MCRHKRVKVRLKSGRHTCLSPESPADETLTPPGPRDEVKGQNELMRE